LDDCRIPYGDEVPSVGNRHRHDRGDGYGFKPQWQAKGGVQWSPEKEWKQDIERQAHEKGRFPANLIVSDGVLDDGKLHICRPHAGDGKPLDNNGMGWGFKRMSFSMCDRGGYSRFFSLDAWAGLNLGNLTEVVQRNLPYLIVPKASKREKDAGLEAISKTPIKGRDEGQDVRNVPQKTRPSKRRNIHPTVKPIQLMAYLVTMGSRRGDIVLDPFAGSGSALIAAQMLKRRFIGIEKEPEYQKIAVRRLVHHTNSTANEDS
jgi:site-specific DNA-methyltransferase (adenine-specific)